MKFAQVLKVTERNRNSTNIMGTRLKSRAKFTQVVWKLTVSDPTKTVCPYCKSELSYKRKKNGKIKIYTLEQDEEVEHIAFISGSKTPPLWMVEAARRFNENQNFQTSDDLRKIVKELHPTAKIQ